MNSTLYPHVRPVCLPPGGGVIERFTNMPALLTAWDNRHYHVPEGKDSQLTDFVPEVQQEALVRVFPPEKCRHYGENFTQNMLCAGGSIDACPGDNRGGALGKNDDSLL